MKVILTKEAEFDFNESKYTSIPSEVFKTLVGEPVIESDQNPPMDKVIVFENKSDYLANAKRLDINYDRSIYVSPRGLIYCFLNFYTGNVTADTEESKEQ